MEDTKQKFSDKFIEKLSSVAGVIGRQRHLSAIRDGFVTLLPFMILGSIVTLINNIPLSSDSGAAIPNLNAWLSQYDGLKWIPAINGAVWWGTFGMLTLFAVFAIAYNLGKISNGNPLGAAVTATATYLSIAPQIGNDGAWGNLNYAFLNSGSLFLGLVIALLSAELYIRLSRSKKLQIKMPASVPPAVSRSFAALLPTILTVLCCVFFAQLIEVYAEVNLLAWFNEAIIGVLGKASGSYPFGFIVVFFTHVFWFFGLHGAQIFDAIVVPFTPYAIEINLAYIENGMSGDMIIFNKAFVDTFVYMGGSGVGMGIVIAMFVAGRSKQQRMLAKLSAAPSLFNINEPIIFGLPIVLNPIFAIPFLLAPVACLTIAYIATAIGFIPPVAYIAPWTTPPIISGLFATGFDWKAPIVQIINLAVSVLIYIPFVRASDKIEAKKEAAEALEMVAA